MEKLRFFLHCPKKQKNLASKAFLNKQEIDFRKEKCYIISMNNHKINTFLALSIILILALGVGIFVFILNDFNNIPFSSDFFYKEKPVFETKGLKTFSSEQEMKMYLNEAQELAEDYNDDLTAMGTPKVALSEKHITGAEDKIRRVSETNVQVKGIDEPDIVKTDGKEIYISQEGYYYPRYDIVEEKCLGSKCIFPIDQSATKLIKAIPPEKLAVDGKIYESGNLLLFKNILIIFSQNQSKIVAYDVSNSKSPEKRWEKKLNTRDQIQAVRLFNDKIYLILSAQLDIYHPCPIKTFENSLSDIKCSDIYHPVNPVPSDVVFKAMIINPASGDIEENLNFLGRSDQTVVYMSQNNLFIAYPQDENLVKFFSLFFEDQCQDLIPQEIIKKIERLAGYDISEQTKMAELEIIMNRFFQVLSEDEKVKIENEFSNRAEAYFKKKIREMQTTEIVKIDLKNFEIKAVGKVPGTLLNPFSLDENNNFLRVAVTIGKNWRNWMEMQEINLSSAVESSNDIYILNEGLKIVGSLKDLGLGEKIYSVRFIEDKGYLVTFKETDPFFVVDLKNIQNPELKGELKIPGYSAYLHPIAKDKILGIGKEGSQIKISLFNVADANNPKEINKYVLNEYWSDILNTHHAFLLDKEHQIFFLPGSKGGYIFSFKNDSLELKTTISDTAAKRAIYVNDYLYIIGENKISVIDENTFEKINYLDF